MGGRSCSWTESKALFEWLTWIGDGGGGSSDRSLVDIVDTRVAKKADEISIQRHTDFTVWPSGNMFLDIEDMSSLLCNLRNRWDEHDGLEEMEKYINEHMDLKN